MASDRGRGLPRQKIKPAEREAIGAPSRNPEGPLQIIVSLGSQRLFVYDKAGLLTTSTVSTGVGGYPTPTGVFAVLDKEKQHYSNIYGGASMPFMQRLTMSGVALHSGDGDGPAGIARLHPPAARFSMQLYKLTRLGVRVIIAPDEPVPADIAHARLFARNRLTPVEPDDIDSQSGNGRGPGGGARMSTREWPHRGSTRSRPSARPCWRRSPSPCLRQQGRGQGVRAPRLQPAVRGARRSSRSRALARHAHLHRPGVQGRHGTEMRWQAVRCRPPLVRRRIRKVSSASRSEAEATLPLASGPPATAAEALDRIELPQEALRPHLPDAVAGRVADRLRSRLQPRDARGGHRLHRAHALASGPRPEADAIVR